ncbi:hypothetical protein AN959_03555 [Psychrobacillus sp. FJAT-21963]|nr:hypothetical protein AN959_03555 [Psychrobacillus sp. FJAT-21963]
MKETDTSEKVEVQSAQRFSKSAFLDAADSNKDRLILQVVLEDKKLYTRDEVASKVDVWKKKEVK